MSKQGTAGKRKHITDGFSELGIIRRLGSGKSEACLWLHTIFDHHLSVMHGNRGPCKIMFGNK
jgi:hypothetical protein